LQGEWTTPERDLPSQVHGRYAYSLGLDMTAMTLH